MKILQMLFLVMLIALAAGALYFLSTGQSQWQRFTLPFLKNQTAREISHGALSNDINSRKLRAVEHAYSRETQTIRDRLRKAARKRIDQIISEACLPGCEQNNAALLDKIIYREFALVFERLSQHASYFVAAQLMLFSVLILLLAAKNRRFGASSWLLSLLPLLLMSCGYGISIDWTCWLLFTHISLGVLLFYNAAVVVYLLKSTSASQARAV